MHLAITGVDGFVGRHVARLAAERGHTVIGLARSESAGDEFARYLDVLIAADLRVEWPLPEPVDAVVHLAGLAAVGPSFDDPQRYIADNSAIVTTMAESMLQQEATRTRIVGVSTGAVYRSPQDGSPQSEASATASTSPYVVSKLLVENQLSYYRTRGLDTVVARPFNHFGPGQSRGFLVPDLTTHLRELAVGATLSTGNLESRRDYTDVRDVANAYLMLAEAPGLDSSTYNVASGTARSGKEILAAVCTALGRDIPSTEVDASRLRANDPPLIVGDNTRLRHELGWAPRFRFEDTVRDAVDSVPV